MKKLNYKNPGETILEVLIAIVLLSGVMIATFSTLSKAIDTNADIRLRITAVNIAREGLEGVRNIRDTNWLKYSGDKRAYWFCQDSYPGDATSTDDGCGPNKTGGSDVFLVSGHYKLDYKTDRHRYYLETVGTDATDELDLDNATRTTTNNKYKIYQIPFADPSGGRFTHDDDGGANNLTPYYRHIKIELLNPVDEGFCTSKTTCADHAARVTSTVQWKNNMDSNTKIVLETILFDYFEREEY